MPHYNNIYPYLPMSAVFMFFVGYGMFGRVRRVIQSSSGVFFPIILGEVVQYSSELELGLLD